MPKKLLYFIIFLLVAVIFFIVNSGNTCNISIVFYTFKDVKVVYSLAVSFVLGMLVILPFTVFKGKKKIDKSAKPAKNGEPENTFEENAP